MSAFALGVVQLGASGERGELQGRLEWPLLWLQRSHRCGWGDEDQAGSGVRPCASTGMSHAYARGRQSSEVDP